MSARSAVRTPQFWCLWLVLCMNVTAGIGILEKAAPMITDYFAASSAPVSASAAAGFVALLSAANMAGRIGWSSASDLIGRKNIYRLYLGAGALMYLLIAALGDSSKPLFVLCALVILSFYGGGFATVPAYLAGAVVVEQIFAWPGMGQMAVNALTLRDFPVITGFGLYVAVLVLICNLLADILYTVVDPRVRSAR